MKGFQMFWMKDTNKTFWHETTENSIEFKWTIHREWNENATTRQSSGIFFLCAIHSLEFFFDLMLRFWASMQRGFFRAFLRYQNVEQVFFFILGKEEWI